MRQEDMATFYPTSSSQIDVLSSSYIEDQKFTPFSEQPILHGNNMMMYLNNPSSTAGSFPGISPSISSLHNEAGRNEMMFIPPTCDSMCIQAISAQLNTATTDTQQQIVVPHQELQLTSRTHQLIDGEKNNLHGLSLSLSTQIANTVPPPSFQHHFSNPQALSSVLSSHVHGSGGESSCRPMSDKLDEGKDLQQSSSAYGGSAGPYELHGGDGSGSNLVMNSSNLHSSVNNNSKGLVGYNSYQYEQAGIASALLKSKYLKAAQMLLDEVVNVREALKQQHDSGNDQNKMEEGSSESKEKSVPGSEGNNNNEPANGSTVPELSPTERQDLQNKLDKLLAMLDEVDRRYKQYYHQMQILVSSFDMVAGSGAAKPYTTLALKTISRHFRCLRDAISGQIQQTRKSLGDQDSSQGGVIPRLRYIDQQLRQQRALQQFGMMRHAWRPQRGLPENAVTILRAWLFEHFLHPYPKDSEKIMLARQTGLTRSQVANWFINARVRLWKPMVEEMYKEEFGESDLGAICKSSPENTTRGAPQGERSSWISEDRNRREDSMQESISSMGGISNRSQQQNQDESGIMLRRPAAGMIMMNDLPNEEKHRGMLMKLQQDEQYQHHRQQQQHSLGNHHGFYAHDQNGFMVQAYHVPGLGGYSMDNNQVSLALGLRRIEGDVGSSLGSGPAGSGFRSNSGSMENGMAVAAPGTGEYHPSYIDPVVNQQQHVW